MGKIFAKSVYLSVKATVVRDETSYIVGMVVGTLGTIVSYLLSGYDYPLYMLVGFIVINYNQVPISSYKRRR